MQFIKKILYKILPESTYLSILHRSFYLLYDLGLLKNDARFKYHYMVKQVINKDDVVLDIGANLGYFSKNFARLTPEGKVISIEPIPQFYAILKKFLSQYPNVDLHNVAFGQEEGSITMVLPKSNGMIRTGLPHISKSKEEQSLHATQDVQIVQGSKFLHNLEKLNYIKCDIEGYEWNVLRDLKPLIEQFQPYVQIEVAPENRSQVFDFFKSLDYTQFGIVDGEFVEESGEQQEEGDFFFVPQKLLPNFKMKFNLSQPIHQ